MEMNYRVLDTLKVGNNTSVTIEGKGEKLHNNMTIFDDDNIAYILLSVAMLSGEKVEHARDRTILLIEGEFNSESVNI